MQYASALLANLSSTKAALDYVQKNAKVANDVLNIGLSMLKEKIYKKNSFEGVKSKDK